MKSHVISDLSFQRERSRDSGVALLVMRTASVSRSADSEGTTRSPQVCQMPSSGLSQHIPPAEATLSSLWLCTDLYRTPRFKKTVLGADEREAPTQTYSAPFRAPPDCIYSLPTYTSKATTGIHSTVFSGFWCLWDCGPFGEGAW